MFPGSLQLGKWRTRGSDEGRFVLERLDDDGKVQTNGWVQAAAFTHNANTNASGLEVETVRAQTLLIGPDPLGDPSVAAWVDGKIRATDNLQTTTRLRADTIAPFLAGICRVDGAGLIVDGEVRTDTIRAREENGTTSVSKLAVTGSLTVGGASVIGGSPYWVAGKVHGDTSILVSNGRVAYTIAQTSAGNFRIDFASPHPNGVHYVISLTWTAANYWVDGASITASSFLVAFRTSNFSNTNVPFFFMVLA
jgi:hypothetical protein